MTPIYISSCTFLGTTFSLVTGFLFEDASVDLTYVSYGVYLGKRF